MTDNSTHVSKTGGCKVITSQFGQYKLPGLNDIRVVCARLEASLTATATTRRRLLAEALAPADAREMDAAQ